MRRGKHDERVTLSQAKSLNEGECFDWSNHLQTAHANAIHSLLQRMRVILDKGFILIDSNPNQPIRDNRYLRTEGFQSLFHPANSPDWQSGQFIGGPAVRKTLGHRRRNTPFDHCNFYGVVHG